MDNNDNPKYNGAVFFVDNVEKSKKFYTDILGQKIEMDFGRYVGFIGGYAIWDATYASNIMGLVNSIEQPLGKGNVEIYFEINDLDSLFDKIKKENIDFVHEIKEQPWGQRCFRIYDPDKHIIEFGEPMPVVIKRFSIQGLSIEEIVKKTLIPLDIVNQVLGK
jgi:catechol 2,3-dioxygenase-like lactoylglutathione lyase family enzyme